MNTKMTEEERNNLVAMTSHTIVAVIMVLLAFLKFTTGGYTVTFLIINTILGLAAPIGERIFWKKDHESPAIKHFLGYGYAAYFTFVIFTTSDGMIFFFALPLVLVIAIYNDPRYTLKICTGLVIEALMVAIVGAKTGGFGFTTVNNAFIEVLVMLLVAVFSYWVARTININNNLKLDKIKSMMENTDQGLVAINDDLKKLLESTDNTRSAMEQVSDGTNNTAEAVQTQMLQTSAIGEKTHLVETAANEINTSMQQTIECVYQGKEDLRNLIDAVDDTVASGEKLNEMLNNLQDNMSEMNNISKMIDSIAFQTNILALNANVEAARAGEAGRGFAVVAEEVSAMSLKTKTSTEEISQMINNISNSLNDVSAGIKRITDEITAEKVTAEKSEASFAAIEENASSVNSNVSVLVDTLGDLAEANRGIMDSIQTISAVSEEVSALASEARNQEFQNTEVLNHIAEAARSLTQ